MLKPVARRFYENAMMDLMPQTPAERTDFGFRPGIDQTRLIAAYRDGIRQGKISEQSLSDACCDGPSLTALLRSVDPTIVVQTDWDDLMEMMSDDEGDGRYASGDC
jgi:hypothetical protein